MTNEMNLAEMKAKVLEALQSTDSADADHITQELLDQDKNATYEEDGVDEAVLAVREGHNVRYWHNGNEYVWAYQRGRNQVGQGCGNDVTTWLPFSWSAKSIGRCTGNDHLVRFTK